MRENRSRPLVVGAILAFVLALPACSVRKLAVNSLGDALSSGTSAWGSDDDPDLVRDATPFALKTIESLLAESPRHVGLLTAACSGFTQYGYAFVASEADYLEATDLQRALAMRERARKLYRRALGYGLRGLDASHPGFEAAVRADPARVLLTTTRRDVSLLYWTGLAWGALISLSKDNGEVAADLTTVAALERRAIVLDEGYGRGSIFDFFISYEGGLPPSAGGSAERARRAFARAVALSGGLRASPYVSLAESVSVAAQDRKEFEELLQRALAIDVDAVPSERLANLVAQRRARWLLSRADELFIEQEGKP